MKQVHNTIGKGGWLTSDLVKWTVVECDHLGDWPF